VKSPRITHSAIAAESVSAAERADDRFFAALRAADVDRLDQLLTEDFVIVEVVGGPVVDRGSFIAAVGRRLVDFGAIDVRERNTRRWGDTAIVVGRTEMSGSVDAVPFAVASRYTHVFVRKPDRDWRLISAQGTPMMDSEERREAR
jgi:ketosteroid isomerase-like protein